MKMIPQVTVITKADLEAQAMVARRLHVPPPAVGYEAPNPRWPWDPPAALDAPGIDCEMLPGGSRYV